MSCAIDALLSPYQRFGVNLGLNRIRSLLANLGNPQDQVPIIHVGGTNGKGSVCAYLSSILTVAGYKVGRYLSPHLVHWTERITINQKEISEEELEAVLKEVIGRISPDLETPTLFEVFTAAAWLYFAKKKVDLAVIEVGLGGRLDATNVVDRPLVTIITSISKEHWQVLGETIAKIAAEKAGIFKSECPAIVGQLPPEASIVFQAKSQQLNSPIFELQAATRLDNNWVRFAPELPFKPLEYELPLLGNFQLMNSALAVGCAQLLQQQGYAIADFQIQTGIAQTRHPGRLQWVQWQNYPLLIDGAHNPAAAIALRQYVDTLSNPVTWVMGMLSTKEHPEIFKALLRPDDRLYLVPVPGHSTATPADLVNLAQNICPTLAQASPYPELNPALAKAFTDPHPVILCGSLYLIGYFLRQQKYSIF